MGGLVLAGNTSGSTTLQATDAVTAVITLPSATDTLVGKATTDTLTNKTLTLPVVGTTIGVGAATPSTSGAGITFPATQSASTNANTLDDYEEGTWTPEIKGTTSESGQVYSVQVGKYTKIGNQVTAVGNMILTTKGTFVGAYIYLSLPFIGVANPYFQGAVVSSVNVTITSGYHLIPLIYSANSLMYLFAENGTTQTQLNSTILSNTSEIYFSITYFTT